MMRNTEKDFLTNSKNSLNKKRTEFSFSKKIQIRKSRLDDELLKKRITHYDDLLSIKVENLDLQEDEILIYDDIVDIELKIQEYLYSPNINLVKYSLKLLTEFTENLRIVDGDIELENEIFSRLLELLLSNDDDSIKFEASKSLINIADSSDFYCDILILDQNISRIINMMNYRNNIIQRNIIYLICEILEKGKSFNTKLKNRPEFMENTILIWKKFENFSVQVKISTIFLMKVFFTKYNPSENNELMTNMFNYTDMIIQKTIQFFQVKLIDIIEFQDILRAWICFIIYLTELLNHNSIKICNNLIDFGFFETLFSFDFKDDNSFKKAIFKLHTNMFYEDENIDNLFKKGYLIINLIEKELLSFVEKRNLNFKLLKEILICLGNLVGGPEKHSIYVFTQTSIVKSLLKLKEISNDREITFNVLYFFNNSINNFNFKIINVAMEENILIYYKEVLVSDNDETVILMCLENINNLLKHGENMMTLNDNENYFVPEIQSLGLTDKIQGLQLSKNDSLSKLANSIMEKYFI